MPIASPDDVGVVLGHELSSPEHQRATLLLELAESAVLAEVPGLTVTAETEATITVPGTFSDVLILPVRPISNVTEVAIDGQLLDPVLYRATSTGELYRQRWTDDDNYVVNAPYWWDDTLMGGWGLPTCTVTVKCDHGPAGGVAAGVVLDLVIAAMSNPASMFSETIGTRSAVFQDRGAASGLMVVGAEQRRKLHAAYLPASGASAAIR